MNILIVHAHLEPQSFCSAMRHLADWLCPDCGVSKGDFELREI